MAGSQEDAYCTLLMSDEYLPGAAVLAHSLRDTGTKKKLAVLVTLGSLSVEALTELKLLYDYVIPVDKIANPTPANLYLMDRGDLSFAFTKIAVWRQQRFRKLVYLDSDIIVLRAPDELFDLDTAFAAAPDVGWPDAFNTGVMMLKPDMGEYWALQTMASTGDSFDGADQGLLNQYYQHRNWHRLSFNYNCTLSAQYQWEPAYRYFKNNISIVHFIGRNKPWFQGRQTSKNGPGSYNELLARWWAVYDRHYKAPTIQFTTSESAPSSSKSVQRHVTGEATSTNFGYHVPPPHFSGQGGQAPESRITTTEQAFTDPTELAENGELGKEQRRFSAPQSEWDATRMPPPTASTPEAINFPARIYEFNRSRELFQPPRSYPDPPTDMWYKLPKEPPSVAARPRPIFPWEARSENVKPTRVFSEDQVPKPEPTPTLATSTGNERTSPPLPPNVGEERDTSPIPDEPFASFSPKNVNAWDNHPGIDNYTRAFESAIFGRLGARAAIQPTDIIMTPATTSNGSSSAGSADKIVSPTPTHRRESLILTDFPSAIERPSLPVTPMPIRRPTFWGEDRDQQGQQLPGAEGVPNQVDWDPSKQLENLRRQSLATAEEASHQSAVHSSENDIPERGLPSSSALTPISQAIAEEETLAPPLSGDGSPHGLTSPKNGLNLGNVDF